MENLKKQTSYLSSNQGTLVFRHRCSAGDLSINFNALNWSLDDVVATELQNPPSWVITSCNLASLKSACQITSSKGYTLTPEYFKLFNSSLIFVNFTPDEGEVFTFRIANTSRQAFDLEVQSINRSGILTAGTKVIDFIDAVSIPSLPERCPIVVEVDNAKRFYPDDFTFIPLTDASKSRSILLVDSFSDDVVYNIVGIAAYQPNASLLSQIETVGGQLNSVITDLSKLTNKDISAYQAVPNSVDLASFANTMQTLLNVSVNLVEQGFARHAQSASTLVQNTGGSDLGFNLSNIEYSDSFLQMFTVVNESNATKFYAKKSVTVIAAINGYSSSLAAEFLIRKNGAMYFAGNQVSTTNYDTSVATPIKLSAGDYFNFYIPFTLNAASTVRFSITASAIETKTLRQLAGL